MAEKKDGQETFFLTQLNFLQLHSQQGEAFQMQRMRERILSKQDSRGSQDPTHGGVASQMPRLLEKLQPKEQPEDTSSHAHGRAPGSENRGIGRVGSEDRHHGGQADGG